MDTTTEITMRLFNDLFSGNENRINALYSKYYDSLDQSQSKEVVSNALRRMLNENSNLKCEFGVDSFTLTAE